MSNTIYPKFKDMWERLKFLSLIHTEIKLHIKVAIRERQDITNLLEKGIDYTWIQVMFAYHNSIIWIFLRNFPIIRDKQSRNEKYDNQKVYAKTDRLLEDLSPVYIKITDENIHKYIRLTNAGEEFTKTLGFFTALLKKYGELYSVATAILGTLGIVFWQNIWNFIKNLFN
jgi:hypothetical protein